MGTVEAPSYDWTDDLKAKFRADPVHLWKIRFAPAERIGCQKLLADYSWTAMTAGEAVSQVDKGSTVEATTQPGQTKHSYGPGEVRDLVNASEIEPVFATGESLDCAAPAAADPIIRPVPSRVSKFHRDPPSARFPGTSAFASK
ncbi:hypothetical protein [Mycobacterium malmoense]|uniref:hypothetical protein n=1 Tax=Mycobacterium malmoense TaxID=1780 RepID=UPI001130AFE9|nr:hypothetical protein [Mycobacterium malmoense]